MRRTLRKKVKQTNRYTRKLHEVRMGFRGLKPPSKPRSGHHGGLRDELGVIVTVRDQVTGQLLQWHEHGLRIEALRAITERIDASPRELRVVCYSTPETIVQDLQGERDPTQPLPEVTALSRIGRRELLDSSLEKTDTHGRYS